MQAPGWGFTLRSWRREGAASQALCSLLGPGAPGAKGLGCSWRAEGSGGLGQPRNRSSSGRTGLHPLRAEPPGAWALGRGGPRPQVRQPECLLLSELSGLASGPPRERPWPHDLGSPEGDAPSGASGVGALTGWQDGGHASPSLFPVSWHGLRCLHQLAPPPSVGDVGVLRKQSRPLDRPGGEQPLQG